MLKTLIRGIIILQVIYLPESHMAKKKKMKKGKGLRRLPAETQPAVQETETFTDALFEGEADAPDFAEEPVAIEPETVSEEPAEAAEEPAVIEPETVSEEPAEVAEEPEITETKPVSVTEDFIEKHQVRFEEAPHWIHEQVEDPSYIGGVRYLRNCRCSVCGNEVNMEKPVCPACGAKMA